MNKPEKIWEKNFPQGAKWNEKFNITSLCELMDESANKFKDKTGISCLSLTFSVQAPEYPDYKLLRTGFMEQGTLYKVDNTNFLNYKNENSLWFCAAMNLYFPESPEVIYVQAGE